MGVARFRAFAVAFLAAQFLCHTSECSELFLASSYMRSSLSYCELDLASGQPGVCTSFRELGYGDIQDLSSTPASLREFWAATYSRTSTESELVQVDVASREPTLRTRINTTSQIVALAIDPIDGNFYGATADDLVRINHETGDVETLGPIALGTGWATMAFDSFGTLYGIANPNSEFGDDLLVEIDKKTAAVSPIGALELPRMQGIAFHPTSNELYGVGYGADDQYQLYRIDRSDMSLVAIGESNVRQSGLAFVIPEPGGGWQLVPPLAAGFLALRSRFITRSNVE